MAHSHPIPSTDSAARAAERVYRGKKIPKAVIKRLSLYARALKLMSVNRIEKLSSRELGESIGINSAQVRKDLAYFGQFGYPGIGYRVGELILRVRRILGTDKTSNVMLVGVGNLGRALLSFRGFLKRGFVIAAAFDRDPAKIGMTIDATPPFQVQPLTEMAGTVRERSIRLGILTVPASAAQAAADEMIAAGVRALLNFAPVRLRIGADVSVTSVDLAVHLEQLSFQLNNVTS